MEKKKELRSDIAWSSADKIAVHGYDLTEDLMGKVNLGDMGISGGERPPPQCQRVAHVQCGPGDAG
jgi:hypothetical protein